MKDYEMYDNGVKVGITNIYWENINSKYKKSIIKSMPESTYKVVDIINSVQTYEIEYTILNKDDLYDIVSKYIDDDKNRFIEIDNIKRYNNIKK